MAEQTSAKAYFNKAVTLQVQRQFEEALAAYEQVIRLDPNDPAFHENKAQALEGLGWREEAEQSYLKALELPRPDGRCR